MEPLEGCQSLRDEKVYRNPFQYGSNFSTKKYWSKDVLYKNEHFSSLLTRERFE